MLVLVGCEPGPEPQSGFSADTSRRAGLVAGARATAAGCGAVPGGLWVVTASRRECILAAISNPVGPRPATLLVYVGGDPGGAAYGLRGGRPVLDGVGEDYEATAVPRQALADLMSSAVGGGAVVLLARPGMHGSSGEHARDRHTHAEVALMDGALTELRRLHPRADLALVGFSSGGVLVANLLALRTDIRCAVLVAPPLDLAGWDFMSAQGGPTGTAAMRPDLADPMAVLPRTRSNAEILVVGDPSDAVVPASSWRRWVDAARRRGLRVLLAEVTGLEAPGRAGLANGHTALTGRAIEAGQACASGQEPGEIRQALLTDARLASPRGQPLARDEIAAMIVGTTLRGVAWDHQAEVSAGWSADGRMRGFAAVPQGRAIAETNWWLDGDLLCAAGVGCARVLRDGRFLHLMGESPPGLRATYLLSRPDGPR